MSIGGVPVLTVIVLGLADAAVFALMAMGITLVYKATRAINFAQGEIGTVGAFVAWWLIAKHGQAWGVGALGAVVVAAAIGYAMHRFIAYPMREAPRTSLTIVTLGVAFLLYALELLVFGPSPETLPAPLTVLGIGGFQFVGIPVGSFVLGPVYVLALAVAALIAAGLGVWLTRTTFGLGVLATAQDSMSARLLGIPAARVSAFTWIAAALLGAVAGLLIAPTQGVFFAFQISGSLFFRGLVAALLGGMDSMVGAVLGALVVGEIASFSGFLFASSAGLPELTLLALVLLVMVLRPRGLLGSEATA